MSIIPGYKIVNIIHSADSEMSNVSKRFLRDFPSLIYTLPIFLYFIILHDNFSGMSHPESLKKVVKGPCMKGILLAPEEVG